MLLSAGHAANSFNKSSGALMTLHHPVQCQPPFSSDRQSIGGEGGGGGGGRFNVQSQIS